MNQNDPQTLLNAEISASRLAAAASLAASLLSLGIFLFLVYHDIIRKVLGTSAIGFVVFGALGIAKLGDLLSLRRLDKEVFARASVQPQRIKLSYRQKKETRTVVGAIAIPPDATAITIEFALSGGTTVGSKLGKTFAAGFLPALFAQHPQWLDLLRQ